MLFRVRSLDLDHRVIIFSLFFFPLTFHFHFFPHFASFLCSLYYYYFVILLCLVLAWVVAPLRYLVTLFRHVTSSCCFLTASLLPRCAASLWCLFVLLCALFVALLCCLVCEKSWKFLLILYLSSRIFLWKLPME